MKKKLALRIFAVLSALCLALGVAACAPEQNEGGGGDGETPHTHVWSDAWSSDESNHWHAPTCGDTTELKDKAAHTFGQDGRCTVCGHQGTVEHKHTYAKEWSYDNTYHWHEPTCDDTDEVSERAEHTLGQDGKCTTCDYRKPLATEGLAFELLDDDTYGVAGMGTASVSEVVIPEQYDGKPVTKILHNAFYATSDEPDTSLKSVVIPDSVKEIEYNAFTHCQALESVELGGVEIISSSVFWDTALVSVNLSKVVEIGNYAFYDIPTLKSADLTSATAIGDYAFYNIPALESVTFGNKLKSLGQSAFYRCTSLKSVTIPGSLKEIPKYAFQKTGIETLVIEDGVETILNTAFAACESLREVYFPSTLKSLTGGPFLDTTGIERVYVDNIADWCQIDFGSVDSNPVRGKGQLYVGGEPLGTELIIPEGVTYIGTYAFRWFDNLEKVVLPDSLEEIGKCAFLYSHSIYSLTVGTGLKSITATSRYNTNGSFYGCYRLIEVLDRSSTTYFSDIDFQLSSSSEMGRLETTADGFVFYVGNGVVSLLGYDGPESVVPALPTAGPVGDGTYELHRNFIVANDTHRTLPLDLVIPDCVTKLGSGSLYDNNWYLRQSPTFDSIVIGSGVKELLTDCKVKTVYYKGTEAEFKALFSSWDSCYALQNGADDYYYYSETRPSQSGKFWHYENGKVTVW